MEVVHVRWLTDTSRCHRAAVFHIRHIVPGRAFPDLALTNRQGSLSSKVVVDEPPSTKLPYLDFIYGWKIYCFINVTSIKLLT